MKKLLFLITMLLSSTLVHAYSRHLEITDEGFTVTYQFDAPDVHLDSTTNQLHFSIPACVTTTETGKPALPCKTESFEIPQGFRIRECVVSATSRAIEGECAPVIPMPFEADNIATVETATNIIVPFEGLWPIDNAIYNSGSGYRGLQLGYITVYPMRYDYNEKCSYFSNTVEISISFEECDNPVFTSANYVVSPEEKDKLVDIKLVSSDARALVRNNINILPSDSPDGFYDAQSYLIVCPTDFRPAAERLATWKRRMGYNVAVECRSYDFLSNPENTDAIIKQHYGEDLGLEFVLLLGGGYQIAPWLGRYSAYNHPYMTDMYFACMDGDADLIPDVYLGRMPAHTLEEANIMVDKTIEYEKNPPLENDTYFTTGLHVSKFDPVEANRATGIENPEQTEQRHFIKTSEEIIKYLGDEYDSKRAYLANNDANPKYWNPNYTHEKEMPSYIQKPNLAWDATEHSIISEINNGVRYVLYRGHGAINSWDYSLLTSAGCNQLTNRNLYPVVFSISCLTGTFRFPTEYVSYNNSWFHYNSNTYSLSEKLLSTTQGGAVGVIGANQLSYSGYNDFFVTAMFDAMHPNPGLQLLLMDWKQYADYGRPDPNRAPENRLGVLMNLGLQRMFELTGCPWGSSRNVYDRYSHEIYHCLGDPSLRVYQNKPISKSPTITRINNQSIVYDSRQVVIVDKNTKRVFIKNSNTNYFNWNNYSNYDISLIQDGYVPFLFRSTLQGGIPSIMNIQHIDNGTSVTVNYDDVDGNVSARCCDLYGNTYSTANGESGTLNIERPATTCIVVIDYEGEPVETIKLTPKN